MILSVLICSLESRKHLLNSLLGELYMQRDKLMMQSANAYHINFHSPVEILTFVDNKQYTTGHKRNELLKSATGKYIIFIDDDDWIEPWYIDELLKAAKSDADCFAINGWITTNGRQRIDWRLSKDNPNKTIYENGKPVYLRTTNHITAVKRELALQAGFPDKSNAEDQWYSNRVAPLCKTEFLIHPPMYHYLFSTFNKEYT